ncbi:hypothetical protein RUM43_003271 [Polyplax serrata]|uniref:Uncharacterized protein n=1 Tax=Polyplax serrata TaxID=468196 RepID=A0AAN8S6F6_POLSC
MVKRACGSKFASSFAVSAAAAASLEDKRGGFRPGNAISSRTYRAQAGVAVVVGRQSSELLLSGAFLQLSNECMPFQWYLQEARFSYHRFD